MGLAYAAQSKNSEAESAFRKQLEINPLDKFAHSNLGNLFLQWHKYSDAAPELEKAISLTPDNAQLQVNLGTAYLNLGGDAKAMSAFDKAANLSATPVVWNNIAYELALKKVHLDRAQQYAESAVSATTAASRNVRLDQLNPRDLGVVQSLSAYWDTLGWVHFARGDLDKAEKYIQAAWQLSHRPDIADHLAQIYEKRGQTELAVRMFALALAGEHPEPETRGRLATLLGGEDKIDTVVKQDAPELHRLDRFKLNVTSPGAMKADYFLLFGAAGNVEGTKFISGDDKLKGFADAVRDTNYGLAYPDDSPVKLLRRGTLICSSGEDNLPAPLLSRKSQKKIHEKASAQAIAGSCTFTLLPAEDVRSLE
jgi:tetratricopeptide (TPR) repeat protein